MFDELGSEMPRSYDVIAMENGNARRNNKVLVFTMAAVELNTSNPFY